MVQGLIGLDYNRGCNEAFAYPEVIQQRKEFITEYGKSKYPIEFVGILQVKESYILQAIYIHADGKIDEILTDVNENEMSNIILEVKSVNKKNQVASI